VSEATTALNVANQEVISATTTYQNALNLEDEMAVVKEKLITSGAAVAKRAIEAADAIAEDVALEREDTAGANLIRENAKTAYNEELEATNVAKALISLEDKTTLSQAEAVIVDLAQDASVYVQRVQMSVLEAQEAEALAVESVAAAENAVEKAQIAIDKKESAGLDATEEQALLRTAKSQKLAAQQTLFEVQSELSDAQDALTAAQQAQTQAQTLSELIETATDAVVAEASAIVQALQASVGEKAQSADALEVMHNVAYDVANDIVTEAQETQNGALIFVIDQKIDDATKSAQNYVSEAEALVAEAQLAVTKATYAVEVAVEANESTADAQVALANANQALSAAQAELTSANEAVTKLEALKVKAETVKEELYESVFGLAQAALEAAKAAVISADEEYDEALSVADQSALAKTASEASEAAAKLAQEAISADSSVTLSDAESYIATIMDDVNTYATKATLSVSAAQEALDQANEAVESSTFALAKAEEAIAKMEEGGGIATEERKLLEEAKIQKAAAELKVLTATTALEDAEAQKVIADAQKADVEALATNIEEATDLIVSIANDHAANAADGAATAKLASDQAMATAYDMKVASQAALDVVAEDDTNENIIAALTTIQEVMVAAKANVEAVKVTKASFEEALADAREALEHATAANEDTSSFATRVATLETALGAATSQVALAQTVVTDIETIQDEVISVSDGILDAATSVAQTTAELATASFATAQTEQGEANSAQDVSTTAQITAQSASEGVQTAKEAISEEDVATIESAETSAQSAVSSAEQFVSDAQNFLDETQEAYDAAQIALLNAESAVDSAGIALQVAQAVGVDDSTYAAGVASAQTAQEVAQSLFNDLKAQLDVAKTALETATANQTEVNALSEQIETQTDSIVDTLSNESQSAYDNSLTAVSNASALQSAAQTAFDNITDLATATTAQEKMESYVNNVEGALTSAQSAYETAQKAIAVATAANEDTTEIAALAVEAHEQVGVAQTIVDNSKTFSADASKYIDAFVTVMTFATQDSDLVAVPTLEDFTTIGITIEEDELETINSYLRNVEGSGFDTIGEVTNLITTVQKAQDSSGDAPLTKADLELLGFENIESDDKARAISELIEATGAEQTIDAAMINAMNDVITKINEGEASDNANLTSEDMNILGFDGEFSAEELAAVNDVINSDAYDDMTNNITGFLTTVEQVVSLMSNANDDANITIALDSDMSIATTTDGEQKNSSISALEDGGYVVVWQSNSSANSSYDIMLQRYDEQGNKVEGEQRVNSYNDDIQSEPSVTGLSDGGYVVTWQSYNQDGDSYGIYAQKYNVGGESVGEEISVASTYAGTQSTPDITELDNGGFVIAWQSENSDGDSYGIAAQHFDASGNKVGNEHLLNAFNVGKQSNVDIESLGNGEYVAVWQSYGQDGNNYAVVSQRFNAQGQALGNETVVNDYTNGSQSNPSVSVLEDGSYVVTWQSYSQDGDGYGIYAQMFDSSGIKMGDEIAVNTTVEKTQSEPAITALAEGGFAISWQSYNQDESSYAIVAQTFDSAGEKVDDERVVNLYTDGAQTNPSMTTLSDGTYMLTWDSADQDGSRSGVFGQRFEPTGEQWVKDLLSTNEDSDLIIDPAVLLANDELDNGAFYLESVGNAQHGSVKLVDGQIVFTPDENYRGPATFEYVLTNGEERDTATVKINVKAINDNIEELSDINRMKNSVDEGADVGTTVGITVNANDADSDDVVTYQIVDAQGNVITDGPLAVHAYSGVVTVADPSQIDYETNDTIDFYVKATSTDGSSTMQNYSVEVNNVNEVFKEKGDVVYDLSHGGDENVKSHQVNTFDAHDQQKVNMTALEDGGYIAVWQSSHQDGVSGSGIYAQRYDKDGNAIGDELRVSQGNNEGTAKVTALKAGGFAVSWHSDKMSDDSDWGIKTRFFDAQNQPMGDEMQVNTYTSSTQQYPDITTLDDGKVVVTWSSNAQDKSGWGVYQQTFSADGEPIGSETQVNTYTSSDQYDSAITNLSDGGYFITWRSYQGTHDIYGQRYDANGAKVGDETLLNSNTAGHQYEPEITLLDDGGYVIVWQDGDIHAQRFDADGNSVGDQFTVNDYTASTQDKPVVQATADGGYVIAWQTSGKDGSGYAIAAKQFGANNEAVTEEMTINDVTASEQQLPTIARTTDGYVIGWQSKDADGKWDIEAKRFDLDGRAVEAREATVSDQEDGFLVNTTTGDSQQNSTVTQLEDGGYVIAWQSKNQDGDNWGVYLQRYDENGNRVGEESRVNTQTSGDQSYPDIVGLKDGGYVVTWRDLTNNQEDTSGWGVFAQRFDKEGESVGNETLVNTYTTGEQRDGKVTALEDGGYVVTWMDDRQDGSAWGVYTQRYDSNNHEVGGEVRVNSYTSSTQYHPDITGLEDGGYVVTWSSNQDGSSHGIYMQRYDANGATVGDETRVNSYTSGEQNKPTITSLNGGGYVVTWHTNGADGSSWGVAGQVYDADGEPIGEEFVANTYTAGEQYYPQVAGLEDGTFVITWFSNAQDGDGYGVYAQHFDSEGYKLGNETLISSGEDKGHQGYPDISALKDGGYVITWESNGEESNSYDIKAKRFDSSGNVVDTKEYDYVAVEEHQVSSYDAEDQQSIEMTTLSDGGYIAVWQSDFQGSAAESGIFAQRYDKDGNAIGDELQISEYGKDAAPVVTELPDGGFSVAWQSKDEDGSGIGIQTKFFDSANQQVGDVQQVNTYTNSDQSEPEMTTLDNGNVVITWQSNAQDGSNLGVYSQMFSASGEKIGNETQVNTYTSSHQYQPDITNLNDGGYMVTWTSYQEGTYNIYAQRFDQDGAKVDNEVRINTNKSGNQYESEITLLEDGSYVVVWHGSEIQAQHFNSDGSARGEEFTVNTYTANQQGNAQVEALENGGFVVTWQTQNKDGSGYGIAAREFDANHNPVTDEISVNSTTASEQQEPTVTHTENGYVIGWQSKGDDGKWDVVAKRFAFGGVVVEANEAIVEKRDYG
jgi:hypothetical protein